jgi:hypothetical protein
MKQDEPRLFGRFDIGENVIDEQPLATEIFRQIGFVPWSCEYQQDRAVFSMLGTSPLFSPVEPGSPAPWYDILVNEITHSDQTRELVVNVVELAQVPINEPIPDQARELH